MIVCRRLLPLHLVLAVAGSARAQTPPSPAPASAPAIAPAPNRLPVRLAVQTEAAIGVATGAFRNQLLGGRVDLQFSPRVSFGGYVGYANLKGKDGRAHSALTYAQVEYLAGDLTSGIRFPLRFASGYLGGNGPVVRMAAGLDFPLSPTVDLVTELFTPMIWLTNNQMLLSMNVALELCLRL